MTVKNGAAKREQFIQYCIIANSALFGDLQTHPKIKFSKALNIAINYTSRRIDIDACIPHQKIYGKENDCCVHCYVRKQSTYLPSTMVPM
jgi:hypothetical protein